MLNNNYFYTEQINNQRQISGMTYIRLFHASPGSPEVDVYVNGKIVGKRISYGQFTDYMAFPAGTCNIEAFPVGLKDSPILSVCVPLDAGTVYTLAIVGILPTIGISAIEDEYQPIIPGKVNIRFACLSPNAPSLNLALRNGPELITNIDFTEVSDYISMNPGTYDFVVKASESDNNVVFVPNIRLLPKRNLTFYVLGMYGQQPSSMEVYIPLDGSTYLRDY